MLSGRIALKRLSLPDLRIFYLGVLVIVSLACGASVDSASNSPDGQQSNLRGEVAIVGSSTVFPISEAIAEEFSRIHQNIRVNVASTGTGAGFRSVCSGESEIADASRPIKQNELDDCSKNGIELVEIPVAFDAISVIVNKENSDVGCLSVQELRTIFGPKSQDLVNNWNQINPDFPDLRLNLYGPTTSSGTFDYFTEAVMGSGGAHRGDMDLATEDDPLIAQGVNGTQGGVGYFGLAYLAQYSALVNAVAIRNPRTGECVTPSAHTVEAGVYQPLARPIFIYASADALAERPEVQAFVQFYLENAVWIVPAVGYVALPMDAYAWATQRVNDLRVGTVFGDVVAGTPLQEVLGRIE